MLSGCLAQEAAPQAAGIESPLADACTDRCPIPRRPDVIQEAQNRVQKVESIAQEVTDIRRVLIEERYVMLDQKAAEEKWVNHPPAESDPDWDAYQEWLYIRTEQNKPVGDRRIHVLKKTPAWKM